MQRVGRDLRAACGHQALAPRRPAAGLVHRLHCLSPQWLTSRQCRPRSRLRRCCTAVFLKRYCPSASLLSLRRRPVTLCPGRQRALQAPAPYRREPEGKALGLVLPLNVGLCSVQLVNHVVREGHDGLLDPFPAPLRPFEVLEHSLSRPELCQAALAVRAQDVVAPLVLEAVLSCAMRQAALSIWECPRAQGTLDPVLAGRVLVPPHGERRELQRRLGSEVPDQGPPLAW